MAQVIYICSMWGSDASVIEIMVLVFALWNVIFLNSNNNNNNNYYYYYYYYNNNNNTSNKLIMVFPSGHPLIPSSLVWLPVMWPESPLHQYLHPKLRASVLPRDGSNKAKARSLSYLDFNTDSLLDPSKPKPLLQFRAWLVETWSTSFRFRINGNYMAWTWPLCSFKLNPGKLIRRFGQLEWKSLDKLVVCLMMVRRHLDPENRLVHQR